MSEVSADTFFDGRAIEVKTLRNLGIHRHICRTTMHWVLNICGVLVVTWFPFFVHGL